ncbi:sulfite exporter TauE/SafE family protein [Ammonifex thiophilus]|uniref:Probable membrane transporter protein n=1 Tax=Ammonifex thiophilus TaxID=444093 RepID=A0A3D8P6Z0_9THEO|nr:sulfite exporter TauE/SafE family protein [Ammonifex thiophilus]RDV84318.1 sulfite exporter TauE/SafE family protein [Ammonifex thiophilus]
MLALLSGTVLLAQGTAAGQAAAAAADPSGSNWWIWPLLLFVFTVVLGIVAVLGGVGGGVLFTPLVGGFFPFHLDFVRSAGLLVALSGSLAAAPGLLRSNLASLRLALPAALLASTASAFGALVGLVLPKNVVQVLLGITILFVAFLFIVSKRAEFPHVPHADKLAQVLKIHGIYYEASTGQTVEWTVWRTPVGLILFVFIGFIAGMFGLGAGWANVPVLNLVMGAPLKIAVGTSKFLLSITDTSAAWVYLNSGACLPMIVVPSVVGIMLGSFIGVKLLTIVRPKAVRYIVILLMIVAGIRPLLQGLGIWK